MHLRRVSIQHSARSRLRRLRAQRASLRHALDPHAGKQSCDVRGFSTFPWGILRGSPIGSTVPNTSTPQHTPTPHAMNSRRFYLSSKLGQLARFTFDPRGHAGMPRTGRLTLALPFGFYKSCAAGWRVARLVLVFQSLRGVGRNLPRVSVSRERC